MKIYYILYKITNLINGKIYIGAHETTNKNDSYMGSGNAIIDSIKKHGKSNFKKEILSEYIDSDSMYVAEKEIVDWDFAHRRDTYNLCPGGVGGRSGSLAVVDTAGNTLVVSTTDPRYISGKLKAIASGKCVVTDTNGTNIQVSIDDPRYLGGEIFGVNKDKVSVKSSNGATFQVESSDARLKTGELVGVTKGQLNVKDSNGNITKVSINDPGYLSGKLVPINTGLTYNNDVVSVKDKDGNTLRVSTDDPRYIAGDLKHITTSRVSVKDKDGITFQVGTNDPRYISGELVPALKGTSNDHKDRIWITNPILKKNKRVLERDLESWLLNANWSRGRAKYLK